jgi:trans-aconitate 2-methyltransferase
VDAARVRDPRDTTAAGYFGAMSDSYDAFIRRAVPRYEEMSARLVDYLPPEASRILELGCGTGNLSLRLAARYPAARLTLVDASPEMIAATRERMASAHPDVAAEYHTERFEALDLPPGGFDLVTSSISLHHVLDKAPLYARIFAALAPGGSLRFADQLGGSARNHGHNWRRWLEHCREPGNCDEAEVESLLDHAAAHDHYTPLAEHFAMLSACGFVDLDCVWRNWIWGIVTAERA